MAASEPSVEEKTLLEKLRPTAEDEQKATSVTMTQNPKDNVSNTATESSTPDVPQTKLQDATPNPHQTTQEDNQQGDQSDLKDQPISQRERDLPTSTIERNHQDTSNLTNAPNETSPPTTFHGWLAHSPTSPLTWGPFTPKTWEETDVDIAITHCGVCYSDLCTLRSGWGPTKYPVCVGHEIVGLATRVGTLAPPTIHPGTRLGLGPTSYTCPPPHPHCPPCLLTQTNYCPSRLSTYGSTIPHLPPGSNTTHGGFATHTRQNARSVHIIPEGLGSKEAAVLLCAGATVYEPLKEWVRKGDLVGVVGLGGLGHLAVGFARAVGAGGVVVFSRGEGKRGDAGGLGAEGFVNTAEEGKGWAEEWRGKMDVVICTVGKADMPLMSYLGLVRARGVFCVVGIPEGEFPRLDVMALCLNGTRVVFSDSASWENTRECLEVAGREGVKVWVEGRRMEEAERVVREMGEGRARYRFVLENRGVV